MACSLVVLKIDFTCIFKVFFLLSPRESGNFIEKFENKRGIHR